MIGMIFPIKILPPTLTGTGTGTGSGSVNRK